MAKLYGNPQSQKDRKSIKSIPFEKVKEDGSTVGYTKRGNKKTVLNSRAAKIAYATAGGAAAGVGVSHLVTKKLRNELATLRAKKQLSNSDKNRIEILRKKLSRSKMVGALAGGAVGGAAGYKSTQYSNFNGRPRPLVTGLGGLAGAVIGSKVAEISIKGSKADGIRFRKELEDSLSSKQRAMVTKMKDLESDVKYLDRKLMDKDGDINKLKSLELNKDLLLEHRELERAYDRSLTPTQKDLVNKADKALGKAITRVVLGTLAGGVLGSISGYYLSKYRK